MSAFRSSSAFVLKTALAVLIVAAMLLVANSAWWRTEIVESDPGQLLSVRQALQGTSSWLDHEIDNTEARYRGLQGATAARIDARHSELSREIQALGREPSLADRSYVGLVQALKKGELDRAIRADLKLKLLEQEKQALITLKSLADAAANHKVAKDEVERLRKAHAEAHERLEKKKREVGRIAEKNPNTYRIPGTPAYFDIETTRAEGEKLNEASWAAYRAWEEKSRAFRLLSAPGGLPPFQVERRSVQSVLDPLLAEVDKFKPTLATLRPDLTGTLRSALGIVLAAMLAGVAIKMVLFFLLAPLAARRPPICLLPKASEAESETTGFHHSWRQTTSVVSMQMTIDAGSELLVKADYLQSTPVTSRTSTKLLLNGQYPLSSLASGMYSLTRVQPSAAESVVISSTKDALSEIATIELTEGEAVVLQPQHLVGVVHRRDAPVRISSLWRLASLHAWLTLQFRYLVFHGPATLVVKGCRGVRMETAQPGRTISQAATIGFSANLDYSTVRSETFMAYLMGQKALFGDRFAGPNGFFAYQEIPSTDQRSGVTGRGLQGVMDGMLKAFGV